MSKDVQWAMYDSARACTIQIRENTATPVKKWTRISHGTVASTHCTVQSALSAKSAALFFTFCFFRPHLRLVSPPLVPFLTSFLFLFPPFSCVLAPLQSTLCRITLAETERRSETEVTRYPKGRPFSFSFLASRRPHSLLPFHCFQPRLLSF